jgi:hypothetical protein
MTKKRSRYGARVFFFEDGVVLVKQTVKKGKPGRYVIDGDKERHVDPGHDRLLGEVVRLAGQGKLQA